MPIYYDDIETGGWRADFPVEGKVMAEIKARLELNDSNMAETIIFSRGFYTESGVTNESWREGELKILEGY